MRTTTRLSIVMMLICLSFLTTIKTNAQTVGILKASNAGANSATARAVATDAAGNIYQTGVFSGAVFFGSYSITSAGSNDVFIVKCNSAGVVQWAKRAGGANADVSYGIAISGTSVYIAGNIGTGIANFNTPSNGSSNTITSAGGNDIFIAKYDDAGSFQWAKRAGGTGADIGLGIAANGTSVYITGNIGTGIANFNTPSATGSNEITTAGSNDIFIAKYNDAGSFQWAKRAGGTGADIGSGIAVNGTSVYITGNVGATVANFNTPSNGSSNTITSAGGNDIFIAKYDDAGSFQWAKRAGGSTGSDGGNSIAVNGTSVYITGQIATGTSDFNNPSASGSNEITSAGNNDIFIAKYDNAGSFQWAKRAGGTSADISYGITTSGTSVYITGSIGTAVANFNNPSASSSNEITSAGNNDIFIAKYNDAGSFQWAKRGGSTNADISYGIAANSTSVYITGLIASGTADFNNPSASGSNELTSTNQDAFLAEYIVCTPTTGTFTASACSSYTWVAKGNKVYTASNNTDTIHLTNAGGCDSLVTLNLTILSNYIITASAGSNGSISPSGATSVCSGNSQAYTITANFGYHILDVLVDGVSNAAAIAAGTYTFSNTIATHTIAASFAINPPGTDWTSRTSAADNNWTSVAYGNGQFVAVAASGTGNRVMTSPDGINWTIRTSAADNSWNSVTYGNGLFVAVANSGTVNRVMTSPDGINWTIRTAAASLFWNSVTYGNGLFVAVASNGANEVMTSPDGINWTIRSSPAFKSWYSITYGNGLFVAVANDNGVMTSPDGINWTSRTSAANNSWQSVTYGNGLFVAVAVSGTGNRVMTSPNGVNWTIRSSAADNGWYGVTYGNGLFVAVAFDGIGNRVMTSSNGINWTIRTSAADNVWYGVTYGNGLFVAVASNGTGNRIMTSGVFVPCTATATTTNISVCSSALPYIWNGVSYNTAGTYTKIFTNGNSGGCDSTATLNLTINNSTTSTNTASACGSYVWNGVTYNTSGVYTKTFTGGNSNGCDSTATLNLTINSATTSTNSATACGSYLWNGVTYTTSGVYTKTFTAGNSKGCDSTATLNLTINTATTSTSTQSQCDGNYTWNGVTYNTSGVYTKTFVGGNSKGCDSTATLNLTINTPVTAGTISGNSSVCIGNTTTLTAPAIATGGTITTVNGYHIHTFTANDTFKVPAGFTGTVEVLVVAGGGSGGSNGGGGGGAGGVVYSNSYAVSGGAIPVTVGLGGVDDFSYYTTGTNGTNSVFGTLTALGGGGGGSRDGGGPANAGGSGGGGGGISGWANPNGSIAGSGTAGQGNNGAYGTPEYFCQSAGGGGGGAGSAGTPGNYEAGGNGGSGVMYSISGTPVYYAAGGGGGITCGGGTQGLGGSGIGGNGTGNVFVNTPGSANTGSGGGGGGNKAAGANGIVIVRYLDNAFGTWSSSTPSVATITNDGVVSGLTSGTTTISFTPAGCYNPATKTITVNAASTSTTNISICSSALPYSWNGLTFNTAGSQTAHLTNSAGCDSAATLNLTIKNNYTITASTGSNGTITNSGISTICSGNNSAVYTITPNSLYKINDVLVDGVSQGAVTSYTFISVTTNHTISVSFVLDCVPTASTTTVTSCNNYLWNGLTYTSSGSYIVHFTNACGSDSAATLNLTINNTTTSSSSVTACDYYLWNGFAYATSGIYTKTFTGGNSKGCDSTATLNLTVNYTATSSASATACGTYTWNGVTYNIGGVYTKTFAGGNSKGCDSVAILNLTINNATTSTNSATACGSYTWNGVTYNTSGTYNKTFTGGNSKGCDSIATLNLTINNATTSNSTQTQCGGTYIWNGVTYNTSGTYTKTFTGGNSMGCDSTATLNLTIKPVPTPTITASGSTTVCAGGSVTLAATGNSRNAVALNSSQQQHIAIPHNTIFNITSQLTIEMWVKSTASTEQYLTTKGQDSWYVAINGGGGGAGKISFWINNAGTGWLHSSQRVDDGNWHHVACTFDGSFKRIYIDGNLTASMAATGTVIPTGGSSVELGSRENIVYLNGSIDEVRFWNTARTGTQIQAAMNTSVPVNSTGLVAYYKLDEGTGSTTVNAVNNANAGTLTNSSLWVASTAPVGYSGYVWSPGGATTGSITANTSGNYSVTVTDLNGCTASASQVITINTATTSTNTVTACGSYTWNGVTYNTSGVYTKTFTGGNSKGCDSTATLNLTINNTTSSTSSATACGSYTWNDVTYTTSGTYTKTFTGGNSKGCDSTATLSLVINALPTVNAVSNQIVCGSNATTAINFSGTGGINAYSWVNNNTAIGLAGSGTGNIGSFTGVNNTSLPVTATITVTPTSLTNAFAYVPNHFSQNVSVINTTTNTVVATIPVGVQPFGIVAKPDGSKVYVSNLGSHTISVISTATNTVTNTITAVGDPYAMSISADGSTLYVIDHSSNALRVVNTATNTVIATVGLGANPTGMTISPDGTKVYVSISNQNKVSVISTATNTIIANVPSGNYPYGISISPDGSKVYVVNNFSNDVTIINAIANTAITTVAVGAGPQNVSVSPDGSKAYVTNYGTNNISVISSATNTVVNTINVGTSPNGVSVSADGTKVYVANAGSNNVSVINAATNTIANTINVGNYPMAFGDFIIPTFGCTGVSKTFTITVNPPTVSSTTVTACGSYTWNGVTYNTSGIYTKTFAGGNRYGCDSTATLNLTITSATTNGSLTRTACGSYTWAENNQTYTQSGTYTAVNGCNTATLNLTINNTTTSTNSAAACGSYLWNGITYTTSGTYTKTFTGGNSNGCDSVATLNLTITPATTNGSLTKTACGSYTWAENNQTYTQSGIYTIVNGCNTATLNLTVTNPPVISYAGVSSTYVAGTSIAAISPVNTGGTPMVSDTKIGNITSIGSGFNFSTGIAIDGNGVMYIADRNNHAVKKIDLNGTITSIGSGFNTPMGVAVDATGVVYVADQLNSEIKKIELNGSVSTIGSGFHYPTGVAVDANGVVYVADQGNNEIKKIDINGTVSTIGSGLNNPLAVTVDATGEVYVADSYSGSVKKIEANGTITTISNAFGLPAGITIDNSGAIYVTDLAQNAVQKISGNTISKFNLNFTPRGIAVDGSGSIYVTDVNNNVVKKLTFATYSISPALPAGLSLDATTGVISGTPAIATANTVYTISTQNACGIGNTSIQFATILPCSPTMSTTNLSICPSALPYSWNNLTFNAAGTQTAHLLNSCGSDSAATLTLSVKANYTITAKVYTGNGTISNLGASTVCSGNNSLTYNITPNPGNHIVSVLIDGVNIGAVSTYTFNNVTADHVIGVSFAVNCNPTSSITNTSVCSSQLPYTWNGFIYNGAGNYTVHLTNSCGSDSAAILNLSVKANYTITAKVYTGNGTISNLGASAVCSGNNSPIYTITANPGNHITDVLIDGVSIGAVSTYTFNNVTTDHVIGVSFAVNCTPSVSTTSRAVCPSQLPYNWNGNNYSVAGSYTVHLTNSCGFDSAATLNLTINPTTSSITNASVCSNQLPYVWNGLVFTSAGTQTKSGLLNSNGCDSSATLILSVSNSSAPAVTVSANGNNICTGTIVIFTATPVNGGTAPMYQWKKNGNDVGANSVTYTDASLNDKDSIWCVLTSNSECATSTTAVSNKVITTIKSLPIIGNSFVLKTVLCSIGATTNANNTNTLGGGIWVSSNPNVATVITNAGASGVVTATGSGTATLTYTKTAVNGCSAYSQCIITVDPISNPVIAAPVSMCKGSSTTLSVTPGGGTWSSSTTAITINANTGLAIASNSGTAIIGYSITGSNGCIASDSKTFPVNALPAAPSVGYATGSVNPQIGAVPSSAFCNNRTFTLIGSPAGGSWSTTNTAVVTVTSGGVAQTVGLGSGSIIYTVTNASGCTNSRAVIGSVVGCTPRGVRASEELKMNNYKLYPNPARSFISLNVETLIGNGTIIITDLYGKQVKQQTLSMGVNTIDVSKLATGMYLVSMITSDGKKTEKLIIE